jgi:tripartite-type tricarboxylate transporter receptor subunit TctC
LLHHTSSHGICLCATIFSTDRHFIFVSVLFLSKELFMKPNPSNRRVFLQRGGALAAGAFASTFWTPALSQSANFPLRILCTAPPGSIPDTISRRVAEHLASAYPQGVIVENRPGAAGQIAVAALKAAPADGSTILLAQGAVATIYATLYPKLAYDPIADLQPISLASEMTMALAVGPAVPSSVNTLRELIDWMRENPKRANVGSPGLGTMPHLLEALIFREANVAWQHVGYAGGPPAITDLLGGQLAALVLPEGILRPHKAAGKLRIVATSGAQRSSYFPDVATFVEQGYREGVIREWFAFFAPDRTSGAIIEATSQRLRAAIARPELVNAFGEMGMTAASSAPGVLAKRIEAERKYWHPILLANNIKAE